ncbi:hypothetical protein [Nocardia wallacei]|uniref:hypothetical protein n=1 Tax=Nocardia wallacei TaxID=480035 RepID=UPI00245800C8|nr:hypothetical protein [Nocardia wallacei]
MTPRDELAQLLTQHEIEASTWGWSCKCGVYGADDYVDHLTEMILASFLVVPLSDIQGTEYGSSDGCFVYRKASKREAVWAAEADLTPMQRPILPWTPIPEGGETQ